MQTNPTKDKHIEAAYQKIMALCTEQEQNMAAMLAHTFGQGLDSGRKLEQMARKARKRKDKTA